MNIFSWYDAKSAEEALSQVNATVSQTLQPEKHSEAAVFKSGGIDLLDLMKEGLVHPKKIVNIKNIDGLDNITFHKDKGLRIGANATLSQIASNDRIKSDYLALHLAVSQAATPQLRNMSTLGGNLLQRTRCWYFRSIDHHCLRKGGATCFAKDGENTYHAILDNHFCVSVHASSIATALMAFGATVEITGKGNRKKEIPIENFFVRPEKDITKEAILETKELITAVIIPPITASTRSYYIKQGARESHEWPMADTAVVMELTDSICKKASVVLGAAATVPYRSESAIQALIGKTINNENATAAAEAAMKPATPLSKNGYKVPLFETIIQRAIMQAINPV